MINLLDVGSLGVGRLALAREEIDLAETVRTATELSREEIDRSGSTLELDLQPVHGHWDRVRIEQVVENLVSNAAKYGLGRPVRVFVTSSDSTARIGVEDQGRGIPVEARERIFRPYERLPHGPDMPGLGIGLYVTVEIVKAHGGSIHIENGPSGGSVFIVELPRDPPTRDVA
jgi:signal transduction histidine kinase